MRISDWSSDVCSSDLSSVGSRCRAQPSDASIFSRSQSVLRSLGLWIATMRCLGRETLVVSNYDQLCRVPNRGQGAGATRPESTLGRSRVEIGRASCRERVCQYV